MAWNDLSLPDKARMMQLAVKSGITDLRTIQEVYNKYAEGGPVERRIYNGAPILEEGYKQMQRDTIIDAAVQKALTRDKGVAPIINGEPGMSCIYTVTDNLGTPKDNQQWSEQFGLLPEAEQLPEVNNYATNLLSAYHLGKGGRIYIKPKNRGKFTALKKRTGKSASWFKVHGTPAQRKMATFALNARKWKHGEGGYLGDTLLQIP